MDAPLVEENIMANWTMKGEYRKHCNCLASCPCDTEGFSRPHTFCKGMVAMRILEGGFDGIRLDGTTHSSLAHVEHSQAGLMA
jgi:hypothetical protein